MEKQQQLGSQSLQGGTVARIYFLVSWNLKQILIPEGWYLPMTRQGEKEIQKMAKKKTEKVAVNSKALKVQM